MTTDVVLMLVVSTFLHAGWNLLVRHRRETAPYFMFQMYVVIAAAGVLPFAAGEVLLGPLPTPVYLLGLASGAFCAVYSLGLTKGYTSTDFTVVYPVTRALPVLLVALADAMLRRHPTPSGWLGMTLVALGCLVIPLESFRSFRLNVYFHRGTLWMLLAAAGIVGYSLIDKTASGLVHPGPLSAARYNYLYLVTAGVFYTLLRLLIRAHRTGAARTPWPKAVLGAVMIYFGYGLILWVYQLVRQASYVVAFRQFSIVIGVVLAFVLYRERGKFVRISASVLITLGLVVIALWGG
ncbi:MAG TPA: EamA family transporter [Planctomycetota bacterium]|nr:EamA family transporter [Planctomycetota bacterium]